MDGNVNENRTICLMSVALCCLYVLSLRWMRILREGKGT